MIRNNLSRLNYVLRNNIISRKIHYSNIKPEHNYLFAKNACEFIDKLIDQNKITHLELLKSRVNRYSNIKKNNFSFGFREDTSSIRDDTTWKASDLPHKLLNRNVEITGPANDSKMVINAFNSKANCYMVDLEDSMSPSWSNVVLGMDNIYNAFRGTLRYEKTDKTYQIKSINEIATPHVRVRGLHLFEKNVTDNHGKPVSATVFDVGMQIFHNSHLLSANGLGPFIYMPKLETYEEALMVNNVINGVEDLMNLPRGTVKVTCLIETYPAIFQTTEIIYALKDHIVGLNCGRWDYIAHYIKSNIADSGKILSDRSLQTMDRSYLTNYVKQIVQSCHQRGIHAMGGMSAFIPTGDQEQIRTILEKVTKDKELEIKLGCDGAWVAHPGLIDPIKNVFADGLNGQPNQIESVKYDNLDIKENELMTAPKDVSNIFTLNELRNNISVSIQYISAWLAGNGAAALNGLMEDLATSEISSQQVKQWLHHNVNLQVNEGNFEQFNLLYFHEVLNEEFETLLTNNQVPYAQDKLPIAKNILYKYVTNDYQFIPDIAYDHLRTNEQFKGIKFDQTEINTLFGSKPHLSGVELTKYRGEFLNEYLNTSREDGYKPYYKFLGTSTGISAVNVVTGGGGHVGPYSGGWQANAMKNRLLETLPDTLHVSPEEPAICAAELNNHLDRADKIQENEINQQGKDIKRNNYFDLAMLADLEQGWSVPEKTRIATKKAIENGVNVLHIEDQGVKKRCGHLGDKELAIFDDYVVILRSANLAAQELLGSSQADNQWVRFVARTDALSAKRIMFSDKLRDVNHIDHKFVDWDRGYSPDGKYLYIKQGINSETGNKWGLDMSIARGTEVIRLGIASHLWMETPDADLAVAKKYMESVNKNLEKYGLKARGLYNHSPSFDWDVKFYAEAKILTDKFLNLYNNNADLTELSITLSTFLNEHGNKIVGDDLFTQDSIKLFSMNIVEYFKDHETRNQYVDTIKEITSNNTSILSDQINNIIGSDLNDKNQYYKNICDEIVRHRLTSFEPLLANMGFDLHLITLPEFHVLAHNMHELSRDFEKEGINAFVRHAQRPERIKYESDSSFTYYKHQTATGTGLEAQFNKLVGSSDVNILSDSTEADDIGKRSD